MAKRPVEWHQECLKNAMLWHEQIAAAIAKLQEQFNRNQASIERLQEQIERALREGKDGFDADKYEPKKGGE